MSPAAATAPQSPPSPVTPLKRSAPPLNAAERISFQEDLLSISDRIALRHRAVNTLRSRLGQSMTLGHVIWVQCGAAPKVITISGQDAVDRTTPFAQWLTRHLRRWQKVGRFRSAFADSLPLNPARDGFSYPFTHTFFAPFDPVSRAAQGGLLFTRERAFTQPEQQILTAMTRHVAVAAAAHAPKNPPRLQGRGRLIFWLGIAALGAIACIPVRTSALAPAEIVAQKPSSVSAELDGVVSEIAVTPGERVSADQILIRFDDTQWRNAAILAERALRVAQSRVRQANLSAFHDDPAKRSLAVAQAERDLAQARYDYAREQLESAVLRAPRDGIALFSSVQDWEGRPVRMGDAILRIADPAFIQLRIDAPLAHGEALTEGADVKFFPDSHPLRASKATLTEIDFEPSQSPDGKTAYRAQAKLDAQSNLRIGARGVAKIYGPKARLGYVLIRRPLTLVRQWTGL